VLRADELEGYAENSEKAREPTMIAEALGAYECKRRPDGKVPGGKGWAHGMARQFRKRG